MNSLIVIALYKNDGMWVFDDPLVELIKEPFVTRTDKMIDRLVSDVPDAERGFNLLLSLTPFPGYNARLQWRRAEEGGNWYYCRELDLEGRLCTAVCEYFEQLPLELYTRAQAKKN